MKINELNFDNHNANKHTQKGLRLLEKSLSKLGAGRSILIDKDNNIIAGNGVVEVAGQIGLDKIKVVETDGTELIAVKRKDVSINSKKGRELAIADNQTAKIDIDFDYDVLTDLSNEYEFDLKDWDFEYEFDLKDRDFDILNEDPNKGEYLNKFDYSLQYDLQVNINDLYKVGNSYLFCSNVYDFDSYRNLVPPNYAFIPFGSLFLLCKQEDLLFIVNPNTYICSLMLKMALDINVKIEKL